MPNPLRRTATPLAAAALAVGAIALGTAPASAHAELTPSTTVAGEYAVLTFSIGHGCDGSATTDVAIDIPKGIDVVTPTINDGWKIAKQTEPIPNVDTSDPEAITERTTRVTYAAETPLADGYRDTFELAVPLPDKAGETIAFPTVQTCEKGRTDWTQLPKAGQSAEELDTPAPAMELTSADDDAAEPASTSDESDQDATDATDSGDDSDDTGTGTAWAAMIVGIAGLAVGGTALVRTRSRG